MHRPNLPTLLFLALLISAHSQTPDLYPTIANRTYADGSITVHAPPGWTIEIDSTITTGDLTVHCPIGAILRHAPTLSTFAPAVSRSAASPEDDSEKSPPSSSPTLAPPTVPIQIPADAGSLSHLTRHRPRRPLVQPQRTPCRSRIRPLPHPNTSAAIWYGSYFTNHCPPHSPMDEGCGGNFLLRSHLNQKPAVDLDEMVFGLSFDPAKPNRFPHRNDPALRRILRQATGIVLSIQYH